MTRWPDVEFLDGPDDPPREPGDDATDRPGHEDLAQPDARLPTRRAWLIVVLVVAVAAALIVRAVAGGHDDTAAGEPSGSATRSVPAPGSAGVSPPRSTELADCPRQTVCEVTHTLPGVTLAAIRGAFPHAVLQSATSLVVTSGAHFGAPLIQRRAAVRADAVSLTVSLRQASCAGTQPGDRITRQLLRNATLTQYDRAVAGDVEGSGRPGTAYCFLVSISLRQPPKTSLVQPHTLDVLSVDASLQSAG